jgi:hypothetical protein
MVNDICIFLVEIYDARRLHHHHDARLAPVHVDHITDPFTHAWIFSRRPFHKAFALP